MARWISVAIYMQASMCPPGVFDDRHPVHVTSSLARMRPAPDLGAGYLTSGSAPLIIRVAGAPRAGLEHSYTISNWLNTWVGEDLRTIGLA